MNALHLVQAPRSFPQWSYLCPTPVRPKICFKVRKNLTMTFFINFASTLWKLEKDISNCHRTLTKTKLSRNSRRSLLTVRSFDSSIEGRRAGATTISKKDPLDIYLLWVLVLPICFLLQRTGVLKLHEGIGIWKKVKVILHTDLLTQRSFVGWLCIRSSQCPRLEIVACFRYSISLYKEFDHSTAENSCGFSDRTPNNLQKHLSKACI